MKMTFKLDSNKVCCFSDLHLGVHQNSTQWHDIAIEFGKWMKKELKKRKIKDIIFCGDLLHYRDEVAVNTIQATSEFLSILNDFNIVMIPGNHDCYFKNNSSVHSLSILKGHKNILVYDKLTTDICFGKKLTFCPWGVDVDEIPKSDFVFGHFEIASFKLNEHKLCEHGFTSEDLFKKSPSIITGHFHTRQTREYSNGNIYYLGSPYNMDFGDSTEDRGISILDINTGELEFIANKVSPKHRKLKLSEIKESNALIECYAPQNFVKFVIDTKFTPEEVEEWIEKINSYKPLSLTVDYKYSIGVQKIVSDMDFASVDVTVAIKEFIDKLEIENKKDIIEYTLELYKKSQ